MTRVRARGEAARRFVLENLTEHPRDICRVAMKHFGITRQALTSHLRNMVKDGQITKEGKRTRCTYKLVPLSEWRGSYRLGGAVAESDIWIQDIRSRLGALPENAMDIWQYGFTEMMNNAIDHSGGTRVSVVIKKTAATVEMLLHDDGVGIFRKVRQHLGLMDERHAVLELAKGKFTTDPRRHSGEGIFFTSRMFDGFDILSGNVYFSHQDETKSDYIADDAHGTGGTSVFMTLNNHTSRTRVKVYDRFTDDEAGFTRTVVPVRLAKYGDDNLVSRSQAKRLLARVEVFRNVILDFSGVDSIGQAFADEAFRVFPAEHPNVTLVEVHANSAVKRMIAQARSQSVPGQMHLPLSGGGRAPPRPR